MTIEKGGFNRPLSYSIHLDHGTLSVYGGAGEDAHIVATGSSTSPSVAAVRALWPDHLVSRADVALDFDQAGLFDRLHPELVQLADNFGRRPVQTSTAGDWFGLTRGRTLYLGARSSAMLLRLYEKGPEQAQKHPDKTFSPHWVRLEWQYRPHTSQKAATARMEPADVMSATSFARTIAQHVSADLRPGVSVPRTPSTNPEFHMIGQYHRTLNRYLQMSPTDLHAHLTAQLTARDLLAPVETPF